MAGRGNKQSEDHDKKYRRQEIINTGIKNGVIIQNCYRIKYKEKKLKIFKKAFKTG